MKNLTKVVTVLLLVVMTCSFVGCGSKKKYENAVQEFYDAVLESQVNLNTLADAIYNNWYDAIYNDDFRGDINIAIAYAFSDNSTIVDEIEANDETIKALYKLAKESELSYEVKAVMQAYNEYYEFVVNVSGSFSTFKESNETNKKALATALKNLNYEI